MQLECGAVITTFLQKYQQRHPISRPSGQSIIWYAAAAPEIIDEVSYYIWTRFNGIRLFYVCLRLDDNL